MTTDRPGLLVNKVVLGDVHCDGRMHAGDEPVEHAPLGTRVAQPLCTNNRAEPKLCDEGLVTGQKAAPQRVKQGAEQDSEV